MRAGVLLLVGAAIALAQMNDDDCKATITESIPQGMPIQVPLTTSQSWIRLINQTQDSIDITSFYWCDRRVILLFAKGVFFSCGGKGGREEIPVYSRIFLGRKGFLSPAPRFGLLLLSSSLLHVTDHVPCRRTLTGGDDKLGATEGQAVYDALVDAAERGVKIRIVQVLERGFSDFSLPLPFVFLLSREMKSGNPFGFSPFFPLSLYFPFFCKI